ncbi:MAG: thiamine pyrophosphate-dependent enzyme [Oscillospiraceae bacterium]
MEALKKPSLITQPCGFCGGCGHGIIQRLIAECLEELDIADRAINCVDIACCFWTLDAMNLDGIAGPHGRLPAVATGIKKSRPDDIVYIHAGDGASYTIGIAETTHICLRDIPVTMIVVNNGVFGMTGGQMSPGTTLLGQKTTSSPKGRIQEVNGRPGDFLASLSQFDFEFAARGALYDVAQINKTKSYIKKGFQNQINKKGFSLIEVVSACPTNWNMSPVDANVRVKEIVTEQFPLKVYKDRGGKNDG